MKHLAVILSCIMVLAGCSTPSAIDLHTQPIAVIERDPDINMQTGPGKYDVGYQKRLVGFNAVQATIRLTNPHWDPKWSPLCSIILRESGQQAHDDTEETATGKHSVHLRLKPGAPPNLFVDETVSTPQQIQKVALDNIIPVGASTAIRIWWMNGEVVVEENGKTRTKILIDWPIRTLAFIGSTADCRFSDIVLGTMGK